MINIAYIVILFSLSITIGIFVETLILKQKLNDKNEMIIKNVDNLMDLDLFAIMYYCFPIFMIFTMINLINLGEQDEMIFKSIDDLIERISRLENNQN